MSSLASTIWPGVLETDNNDANTNDNNNNDNTTQLY